MPSDPDPPEPKKGGVKPPTRQIGLAGVAKAREMRVAGKFARPTERMWLAVAVLLVLILGAYRYFSGKTLSGSKDDLLAKRRAVMVTVGAEWFPLRDKLERITSDEASVFRGDLVDDSAKSLSFRSMPGIYLRLKVDDAKNGQSIRKASEDSLKDGFTSCLLRTQNDPLARGDVDAGVFPDQPWNLRQAYASTRILTDDWEREVQDSSDTLRLRVFQQQYDKAVAEEIPLAIDIIKKARFFLVVLDEDTPGAEPGDGGKSTSETLQVVAHDARVVVYDLRKDAVVVRLRRTASGAAHQVAGSAITDPQINDAIQRQVNNCSLAQAVTAAINP